MLKTSYPFSENIEIFNDDKEIVSFLQNTESLKSVYDDLTFVTNYATALSFIFPMDLKLNHFDLLIILKHEKPTELGQWEIFVAQNFIQLNTNLSSLLSYINETTKIEPQELLSRLFEEFKSICVENELEIKPNFQINQKEKFIALGYSILNDSNSSKKIVPKFIKVNSKDDKFQEIKNSHYKLTFGNAYPYIVFTLNNEKEICDLEWDVDSYFKFRDGKSFIDFYTHNEALYKIYITQNPKLKKDRKHIGGIKNGVLSVLTKDIEFIGSLLFELLYELRDMENEEFEQEQHNSNTMPNA
jgi:hypothetical protein